MAMPKYQMSTPDPAIAGKTWGGPALHGDPVGMTGGMPPLGPAGGFHSGAASGGIVNPMGGAGGMSGTPPFMAPRMRGRSQPFVPHQVGAGLPQAESALPWENTNSVLNPSTPMGGFGGAGNADSGVMMGGGVEGPAHYGTTGPPTGGGLPLGMGGPMSGGTSAPGMTMPGAPGSTPTPPNPTGRLQLAKLLSGGRNV
jgi:hypothetical protein